MIWIDRRDRSALRVIVLESAWRRSVRQFGRHFATHIAKAFGSSGWVRLSGAAAPADSPLILLAAPPQTAGSAMYGRRPQCMRNLTICEAFGCSHVFGF
jgi:hypothetical protein